MGLNNLVGGDDDDDEEQDDEKQESTGGLSSLVDGAVDSSSDSSQSSEDIKREITGGNVEETDISDLEPSTVSEEALPRKKRCPVCQEEGHKWFTSGGEPVDGYKCSNSSCDVLTFFSEHVKNFYGRSDHREVIEEDDDEIADEYEDFLSGIE